MTVEGVEDIHHVHVWQLDETHRALECHVAIRSDQAFRLENIKAEIKEILIHQFEIRHSTLEFEFPDQIGDDHDDAVISDCQS